jgi:hemin uptake protein HemP
MSIPSPPRSPLPVNATPKAPQKIDVASLFAGKRELVIVHRGEEYRLRITRQEKLILTK